MKVLHRRWPSVCWESLTTIVQGCWELYWIFPGDSIPQSRCTDTYRPSRKPTNLDDQDMQKTTEEVRASSSAMYSCWRLHTNEEGYWPAKIYQQQLCTDITCSLEDLPNAIDVLRNSCQEHAMMMMMITWSGLLAGIRSLCVSFSMTDSVFCIWHLFIWSNINFQWITWPTQLCLVLYFLYANFQHSHIIDRFTSIPT